MRDYLPVAALIVSGVAALAGVRAATIKVRNSQDDFITDLQKQGRWASVAAVSAAVATALQVIHYLLSN